MISPWKSFEEYAEWVQPVCVRKNLFRSHTSYTLLKQITDLNESATEFHTAITELRELGYDGDRGSPPEIENDLNSSALRSAKGICIHLCHVGEEILMYSSAFAKGNEADDFIHEKEMIEHWERYTNDGRIHRSINELLEASETLYSGYYNAVHNSAKFLLDELDSDFPPSLKRDFVTAQDQFSVGLEEQGFLSAGRGLEGVLRAFAAKKRIFIQSKTGTRPACEATFYDLIEALSRARWRKDKSPVLNTRINKLLHYIRASRNAAAHPAAETLDENWKELAVVVASRAKKLWKSAQQRYAGLVETKISLSSS